MKLLRKLFGPTPLSPDHTRPGASPAASDDLTLTLGSGLFSQGRHPEAVAEFDRLIACAPDRPEPLNQRGRALMALGRIDDALSSFDAAISVRDDYGDAWYNRGVALHQLARPQEAIGSYRRALQINPDDAQAHANCGIVLAQLRRFDAALASFDQAIARDPGNPQVWFNHGLASAEQGRHEHALASYDRATALDPDYAQAHWNRALCHLLLGDFAHGWRGFEWRWKNHELGIQLTPLERPLWLGKESLYGRSILLRCEQGLGDTLQFCRYAPVLHAQGARVILEVQAPLVRLLTGLVGVEQVMALGAALPETDFYCPLMSLPLALQTTLDSIPSPQAYLHSDSALARQWQERLLRKPLGQGAPLRVGVAWAGGFRPHQPDFNAQRDLPVAHLAQLRTEGVHFYSLQVGPEAGARIDATFIDTGAHLSDFSDTAALVSNLDLVIAVDTSVAHLGGALGKPVWLLNRHQGCWRWLRAGSSTPWYASMRIFRQPTPGDWHSVMREVGGALRDLSQARRSVLQAEAAQSSVWRNSGVTPGSGLR